MFVLGLGHGTLTRGRSGRGTWPIFVLMRPRVRAIGHTKIKTPLARGSYFGAGHGTLTRGLILGKDAL